MAGKTDTERHLEKILKELADLKLEVERLKGFQEIKNYPTLAGAPVGVPNNTLAIIRNGCKPGEGAGMGTGVLAIFNSATARWLNVHDHTTPVAA